jgi:predicted small metal-binding protein
MPKVLKCREVGLDCDFVARAESEQELMAKAAEHARKDHGIDEIPEEVLAKVKASIHDE